MKNRALLFSLCFFSLPVFGEDISRLFEDLALVDSVNKSLQDKLPILYNSNLMVGNITTPSARMNAVGSAAAGGGRVYPSNNYGINIQFFDRLELGANYRVFTNIPEKFWNFFNIQENHSVVGHFKFGLLTPQDGFDNLPSIAVGATDFFSNTDFKSQYIVGTQVFKELNLEVSLGYGKFQMKGPFGGAIWTPFRQKKIPFLKDLSLMLEYDPIPVTDPTTGKKWGNRWNAGVSLLAFDTWQVTVASFHGKELAATTSIRFPLGTMDGLFAKTHNPPIYSSPIDTEPLGIRRPENEFAQDLTYALKNQGLALYQLFLIPKKDKKELYIKVINNQYREKKQVKERLANILASLLPENIESVTILIEADALACFSYKFNQEALRRYKNKEISWFELDTLSPEIEAIKAPSAYEASLLFERKKEIASFVLRPRLVTFFGSNTAKIQYNFSVIATPEGYIKDSVYYKVQARQTVASSFQKIPYYDPLNPSQLPHVRTDTVRYFQTYQTALEMAYLQKSWNLGKGFFTRLATGYFEPAYGGGALEFLYHPIDQDWGLGIEGALLWKRDYTGLWFTRKIGIYQGDFLHYERFLGTQYFLDFYYLFRPLMLDIKLTLGQFLAKDKGLRTEVGRTFSNGIRFGLWYTITNGHDIVNGKTYYDKGFMFSIPLDFFLKKSHRQNLGYAMSSWLRDVGAQAETGKKLWQTLSEERN